ncbi:MAG TPA: hypothetical protein VNA65_08935 [Candidatus Dormibacteraeota bacterium]|nr:hypothetical protein [Candidatus Dormibacteraeota bacterium]
MNDFDRLLELQLREMLDPVAGQRPPTRGQRSKKPAEPLIVVLPAPVELAAEPIPVIAAGPVVP